MQKAEHMYGGCMTAFTTVYRKQNSPYSAQWQLEEHSEAFGNDAELKAIFQHIMVAEREYCTLTSRTAFLHLALADVHR